MLYHIVPRTTSLINMGVYHPGMALFFSHRKKRKCKDCSSIRKPLSNKGICDSCATKRIKQACKQIKDKDGPAYEKYKKGMRQYIKSI